MAKKPNQVIIIIIAHKSSISEYEEISLKQCFKIFGEKYPIRLLCPNGLDISCYKSIIPNIMVDFIHKVWLMNYRMFEKLKVNHFLYKKYIKYHYILFYELDAFVFRDELEYWCNLGYDYIGAPWFGVFGDSIKNKFNGVGNGGFSLRKTKSHYLIALICEKCKFLIKFKRLRLSKKLRLFGYFIMSLLGINYKLNKHYFFFNYWVGPEDRFWSNIGAKISWFRVADYKQALKFAFELNPRELFDINNQKLPFGVHAWYKYDLDFWRPFIESEGYKLD